MRFPDSGLGPPGAGAEFVPSRDSSQIFCDSSDWLASAPFDDSALLPSSELEPQAANPTASNMTTPAKRTGRTIRFIRLAPLSVTEVLGASDSASWARQKGLRLMGPISTFPRRASRSISGEKTSDRDTSCCLSEAIATHRLLRFPPRT